MRISNHTRLPWEVRRYVITWPVLLSVRSQTSANVLIETQDPEDAQAEEGKFYDYMVANYPNILTRSAFVRLVSGSGCGDRDRFYRR